eukprot:4796315-Amphidinium_carterae.1
MLELLELQEVIADSVWGMQSVTHLWFIGTLSALVLFGAAFWKKPLIVMHLVRPESKQQNE